MITSGRSLQAKRAQPVRETRSYALGGGGRSSVPLSLSYTHKDNAHTRAECTRVNRQPTGHPHQQKQYSGHWALGTHTVRRPRTRDVSYSLSKTTASSRQVLEGMTHNQEHVVAIAQATCTHFNTFIHTHTHTHPHEHTHAHTHVGYPGAPDDRAVTAAPAPPASSRRREESREGRAVSSASCHTATT